MRPGDNTVPVRSPLTELPPVPEHGPPSELPPVPELPSRAGRSWWMTALPAVGTLGALGFLALAPRSPFIYAAGGVIVLVSIGMVVGNYLQARRERRDGRDEIRVRFLAELQKARDLLAARDARLYDTQSTAILDGTELYVPLATDSIARPVPVIAAGPRADPFCLQRVTELVQRTTTVRAVPSRYALPAELVIAGAPPQLRGLIRNLLRRIALDLQPTELRIAVLTASPHRWRALRWAPHHRHPTLTDDCGAARLVSADGHLLVDLLAKMETPVLLLVDGDVTAPPELLATARWVLRQVPEAQRHDLLLDARGRVRGGPRDRLGKAVVCSAVELEAACRTAARRATAEVCQDRAQYARDEPMRPLLGTVDGDVLRLDVRESSRGGTGPHGLLVGVTGSGKSEVLRTLVCGLLAVHPPAELSMLLIDFKGGATFTPFQRLPQVAAVITNLEDDPALVDRVHTALAAELRRRQQVIKDAGAASIDELPPPAAMPRLLVVVDEFSELLAAHPATIEVLVQVGRLGRSLGVHLLIAAQRLDEGRLKGLDSHLTYRIALRTQSVAESRAVIGTGDAAALPNAPGHGYLRCGSAPPVPFRARYTGAKQVSAQPRPQQSAAVALLHYANGPLRPRRAPPAGPTVLQAAIMAAELMGGERLPIWTPPPTRSPCHDELYDDLLIRPGRGYGTLTGPATQALVGIVDRPDQQRIAPARIDLAAGHLAVVGTTRSGTTTTAVAALAALALRNTPEELNLYLVEPSPATLGALRPLPHVAAYGAGDAERIRVVVRRVAAIIDERESRPGDKPRPRIVLAIDGYARFKDAHEVLGAVLLAIAQRGLAVGVHLVLTTHRWLDLRANVRELFGNRIELRLGEPLDSDIDRRAAALVPRGRPGRGLSQTGHPLYAAKTDLPEVLDRICQAWDGPRASGFARLPGTLTTSNLATEVSSRGLCLAVERSVGRAVLLPEEAPYCMVIGDPGSGRTSVLRSLGLQDARRGAQLLVVDPRRRLLGSLPTDRLLGYAATPAAVEELIAGLVTGLERRMPPPQITARELHERSWWDGPPLQLIVDDHDLVTLVGASIAPLRRFLPYAPDIGLRVTIARRAAGACAALHDETLSVLRDLGSSALLLSRAVDEGPLLGARPGPSAWGTGVAVRPGQPDLDVQAVVERPT